MNIRDFDSVYYDGWGGGGYTVLYLAIVILIFYITILVREEEPIFGMMSGLSMIMVIISVIWAARIPSSELNQILSYHRWILVVASFIVLMSSIWQWKTVY